jgi:hypothetical protein
VETKVRIVMGKIYLGIDFQEQTQLFALKRRWGRLKPQGHWQVAEEELSCLLASICQELTDKEPPTVVVGLPRRQVIYREFTLPPLKKSALAQAVGYQLVDKSPFEPDQIKFAYQVREIPEGWQTEAIAVPVLELSRISSLLQKAGFRKISFALSSQAMAGLAGKGDYLVGRVGHQLELGLASSWWGRDLPLPEDPAQRQEQLDRELERTVSYLEGQTGRKLQPLLSGEGHSSFQPALAGQRLKTAQFVAAGLALSGAKGRTLQLCELGQKQDSWLKNPYLAVPLCLWLALGAASGYLALSVRQQKHQLAQVEPAAENAQTLADRDWEKTRRELERLLPSCPPAVQLSVLRQLALSRGPGEGYISLAISQGEVKELSAVGPKATDFIRRLKTGPLSALSLEGPIVEEEGKERFTLTGPLEADYEDE